VLVLSLWECLIAFLSEDGYATFVDVPPVKTIWLFENVFLMSNPEQFLALVL
jgi:hypothetical protein